MGSKSQPRPPPTVNPNEVIRAQAQANRVDQFTPFGSLTFGGPDRSQATLQFSPEIQSLFANQLGLDQSLLGAASSAVPGIEGLARNPLDTQGLPGINIDSQGRRDEVERAFFDRSSSLLDEQFARDEDRLRQRLANQGLQSGGQAFDQEFGLFNQRRGETFENLARDAVLFGGQESSRELADQANLRGQLFGERGAVRSNQFNELASLLGLQQTQQPQLGNFFGPGQINAIDPFALQQQGLQNTFNVQSRNAGGKKGSGANLLGTLGAAAISSRK